jgi:two-component system, NtrC family, sensor kinase
MVVASLLGPALVFCIAAWDGYHQAFHDAENRGAHINRLLEEHAAKTLETIVVLLRQTDRRLQGIPEAEIETSRALWEEIRTYQQMSEQTDSLFVIDGQGRNILTTRGYPAPLVDFSDRDYFIEQQRADRGVFLGQSYIGRISNHPIFNLSIRRTDPAGGFTGVIGSSVFVSYFQHFYSNIGAPSDNAVVSLIRSDGAPLVSFPPMQAETTRAPVTALAAAASGPEAGTFWLTDEGVRRLYTYRKLKGYPAYVAYGIDRQAILSDWYRHLAWWGLITGCGAVLLCLTSLVALRRAREEQRAMSRWKRTSSELYQEIERRERAEAALLQSQKLEALGQLTGGIAHDFNNLLTIILGSLASAERQTDPEKVNKRLRDVRYAAERAETLTRQLLAFSRRQELRPESVVLARCWSAAARRSSARWAAA